MAQATRGGANMEPTEAPMLYTPPATPRSLAGNQSAVAFMPAGLAEPSVNPSSPRSQANACEGMSHIHERPRDRENREPDLQAKHIQHVPADRLRHDGALKGANNPRILPRTDVQFLKHRRGGYCACAGGFRSEEHTSAL